MCIKIFFIIAVACIAQVINAKDISIKAQLDSETIQLWNRRDDFGSLMILSEIEFFLESSDPNTSKCYKKFLEFYVLFTKAYSQECTKLASESQKRFVDNFKNVDKLDKLLTRLAQLTKEYPYKLLHLIEKKQTEEAIEYINESWFKLEFTEVVILGTLKGLKKNNRIMATKGEKTIMNYTKIRKEAKNKAAELLAKFESCMETQ